MNEPIPPTPGGEFLFYQTDDGRIRLQVRVQQETVWLSLSQMAELFQRDKSVVSKHIKNVFEEGELKPEATDAKIAAVQTEGGRTVSREIEFYNLDVIISVGYRVKSQRGTQFRIWATQRLREYIVKGFTMDDERLKQRGGGNYFEELLARIRDIRSSEKVFWRKVLEIYATSIDYDPSTEASQIFFATVQNKMHWAAHGQTAAEVIHGRANATKPQMGMTNWVGTKPSKSEAIIAKNYLSPEELNLLNRIVTAYLELAEIQALSRQPMYMRDWIAKLDDFLRLGGRDILEHAGSISHEQANPPFNKPSPIPKGKDWPALLAKDGDELEIHYRHTLEELGKRSGMLGIIFRKAQNKIQDPAKLRRLIVDLIDKEQWSSLSADVKGDAYEGLLHKNAEDVKGGAGQYFTPRPLIAAMVDAVRPEPGQAICDPACGTGGFLLAAHDYIAKHYQLDRAQKKKLKSGTFFGIELVDSVTRLCAMNLLLHGIGEGGSDVSSLNQEDKQSRDGSATFNEGLPVVTKDALAGKHGEYEIVLANPPFGKKSSVTIVNEAGDQQKESLVINRDDFWASTSNKQLNFLQHIFTILKQHGRAAVVLPDNVLFEGGAGETIRRELLKQADVHTLLRLPTGIFYAQGVKANVLFFDRKPAQEKPWTQKVWIYDLRTNLHFTLKENTLKRSDLDDFVTCYNPKNRHDRKESERFKSFAYDELLKRDKVNLDIFWLKDEALEESANLPAPEIIAQEIADDLEAAMEQFATIAEDLKGPKAE